MIEISENMKKVGKQETSNETITQQTRKEWNYFEQKVQDCAKLRQMRLTTLTLSITSTDSSTSIVSVISKASTVTTFSNASIASTACVPPNISQKYPMTLAPHHAAIW